MKTKGSTLILLVLFILIAVAVAHYAKKKYSTTSSVPTAVSSTPIAVDNDTAVIRQLVEDFGKKLQLVPLLSARESVVDFLETAYGGLANPELIAHWKEHPESAPGRKTSSPWPDHIAINSILPRGEDKNEVSGAIVYLTSEEVLYGGETSREPIILTVAGHGNDARITNVESDLTHNLRPTTTYGYGNSFEISYPTEKIVESPDCHGTCQLGETIRSFHVNDEVFNPGNKNNFNGANLTINASTSPARGACTSFSDISYILPPQIRSTTINGVTFSTVTTSDAGMSHYYDIHIYRTLVGGTCYEIVTDVGTTNADVYEPARQKFDVKKAFNLLDGIMATLRFTK